MAVQPVKVDKTKLSKEDLDRAIALLEKDLTRKARIKAGEIKGYAGKKYSELSAEQKATLRKSAKRRQAKINVIIRKAQAAGIKVSEAEIDAELKKGK